MSKLRLKVRAAERFGPDADATFREDFLKAVSHLGIGRDQAAALVEASIGRPLAACGAADLLPLLGELLALVRRANHHVNAEPACNV